MIRKFRHLFITSFRWRILINITISYLIAVCIDTILQIMFDMLDIFQFDQNTTIILSFAISFVIFIVIFFRLMDITLRYINTLNASIQQVTDGNYDVVCDIEYDDELGFLAANITALAATLKEKEEESEILKQNERIAYDAERKAEQEKNELITNVAHDLRTPLTSIIGFLDLIMTKEDLTLEEARQYATTAYEKSNHLNGMMDDLFTYTKVGEGGVKLNLAPININDLLMQLSSEFMPDFAEHDIKPILDIQEGDLSIVGDGQLLARVFENLITNAIKYGYDHSDITLQVLGDDKTVTVKVINRGDTIAKEDMPYIFDKFYRADAARTSSTGGTGLGLAIAKSIVHMHKGDIMMTSKDQVTTFIVSLPRHLTSAS